MKFLKSKVDPDRHGHSPVTKVNVPGRFFLLTLLPALTLSIFGASKTIADVTVPITDLGIGLHSWATAINEDGVVAGYFNNGLARGDFLWEEGAWTDIGNIGVESIPYAININKEIAGEYWVDEGPGLLTRAMAWTPEQGFRTLEVPEEAAQGSAPFINDSGQIVGDYWSPVTRTSAMWANSVRYDFVPEGALSARVYDLDKWGYVAGRIWWDDDTYRAFRGVVRQGIPMIQDFGTLGGNLSVARAMNDNGLVVGSSTKETNEDAEIKAFRAHGDETIIMEELVDLPSGCIWSDAWHVNNANYIAGECAQEDGKHFVLWSAPFTVEDLGVLPNQYWGWELTAFTDKREVIINAEYIDYQTAFLWTPDSDGWIDLCPEAEHCTVAECNNQSQCVGILWESSYEGGSAVMWTVVTIDSLTDLVQTVEDLRDSDILNAQQANGLLQKVTQAQAKLDDSSNPVQVDRACYQLTAFIDQIQGLETGVVLTTDQANDLINDANDVLIEYCFD